jgi:two-component system, sensor histidine kinase and response regulator
MRGAPAAVKPYSLARLDFQMPEMNGLVLRAPSEAIPAAAQTALVLLTLHGQSLSSTDRQEFGIESCIIKPVNQQRLFDCMTDAMKRVASQTSPSATAASIFRCHF